MKRFFLLSCLAILAHYSFVYASAWKNDKFVVGEVPTGVVSTDSMEPTLMVGEKFRNNEDSTPKIGDIVAFDCLKKSGCGLAGTFHIVHRLTAIDAQGCMTIIGDNPKYDWSKLPCYMPDDIRILGVVHKL